MTTVPDASPDTPEGIATPLSIVVYADNCFLLLDHLPRLGYSADHEGLYQQERSRFIDGLYKYSCFAELRGTNGAGKRKREDVFPPTLGGSGADLPGWDRIVRPGLTSYLAALVVAAENEPGSSPVLTGKPTPSSSRKAPSAATRKKDYNARLAQQMWREGIHVKAEIARKIGVSPSAVGNYLRGVDCVN